MNITDIFKIKSNVNNSRVISPARTQAEYAKLYLDKFTYFFNNSNIIFELILNSDSSISVKAIDQLLFLDKDLEKSNIYKVIEFEKKQFNLSNEDTLDNKMKYMTLVINTLYEYFDRAIQATETEDYWDEDYEDMLVIKVNYLDVVVATQNYIRTSERLGKYFYLNDRQFEDADEKYQMLVNSLSHKATDLTELKKNRFITTIYKNNGLILNDSLQEKIITNILYLTSGIDLFTRDKVLVK